MRLGGEMLENVKQVSINGPMQGKDRRMPHQPNISNALLLSLSNKCSMLTRLNLPFALLRGDRFPLSYFPPTLTVSEVLGCELNKTKDNFWLVHL